MITQPTSKPPARLLWESGGLWAAMTWRACREAGLPLSPISSQEIVNGGLSDAGLLVVPGGWPSRKMAALGAEGAQAVHRFVRGGGRYLGLCGGAGLALSVDDGLGLIDLDRRTGAGRLPALSGPVLARPTSQGAEHPLWQGLGDHQELHVWWPAQFQAGAEEEAKGRVRVLARYEGPAPGMCTADLRADEVSPYDWPFLEKRYGIRLDPAPLAGRPAALAAQVGQGEAVLSYLHFDTPGDAAGARAMANLWQAWLGVEPAPPPAPSASPAAWADELAERARDLWAQGEKLGLWQPRHPAVPLWRRGARGLELWGLVFICAELAQATAERPCADEPHGLRQALAPIWEHGPAVLAAQAEELAGGAPAARACAQHAAWFPAPRRTSGELARALSLVERVLFGLLSSRDD